MFIDIHTHTCYQQADTTLMLNVFPGEQQKMSLPVYFSVGLHPWHIQEKVAGQEIEQVRTLALDPRVLAIGETGLDKKVNVPYQVQCGVFEKQLAIAGDLGKAVVIHCVRSYSEMLAYRKKSDQSVPWIFHWFNSDVQTAEQLIRKNCYLSFGHMLFKEKSKAFQTFIKVPPDRIFFETDDAGYTIRQVYERASAIMGLRMEELCLQIIGNFARCFKMAQGWKIG